MVNHLIVRGHQSQGTASTRSLRSRADPTQPMADPFTALFASLAERYPDTFGGMYFEGMASIVVPVLDTPDAAALVTEATEYVEAYWPVDATPTIRAVTVRNSYATLTDVLRRVDAGRASIADQGGELFSVLLDQAAKPRSCRVL